MSHVCVWFEPTLTLKCSVWLAYDPATGAAEAAGALSTTGVSSAATATTPLNTAGHGRTVRWVMRMLNSQGWLIR